MDKEISLCPECGGECGPLGLHKCETPGMASHPPYIDREDCLNLLILLSAIESWSFSTGETFPDYLLERLVSQIDRLRGEVLNK